MEPITRLTFLRIEFDTVGMTMRLPQLRQTDRATVANSRHTPVRQLCEIAVFYRVNEP